MTRGKWALLSRWDRLPRVKSPAKKPKKVCEKAAAVLDQSLTEMKPSDAEE